ncbi:protein NO VEIN domain-containing protein [Glutamicibacter endophyticus]|uniref:protein NO VEIN domain-containing protein n=1 Tax=Glutamicibacter endophyticus TaxID=1522174 RepID=UPI003AF15690
MLLTTHPRFSDLSPMQYSAALSWLGKSGLLESLESNEYSLEPADQILSAILEIDGPSWVKDADILVQSSEELPIDILKAGRSLGLDADHIYEQLVRSWGKVDVAERERFGAAGEFALVELLRGITGARIDHVSQRSDGFGYDVAFVQGDYSAHLEVKSTGRKERFVAYISRNEYRVMQRDPCWVMVTVRLSEDLKVTDVGSVSKDWIASHIPCDSSKLGHWETCRLEIPADAIKSSVAELGAAAAGLLPLWRHRGDRANEQSE